MSKQLDENKFWEIVEELEWGETYDHKAISKKIFRKLGPKKTRQFAKMAEQFNNNVRVVGDKLYEKLMSETGEGLGVSDDGFSDLCWHVVGLGREKYEEAMSDPFVLAQMGRKGQYMESFGYAIPSEDLEDFDINQYRDRASEYIKGMEMKPFLKISKNYGREGYTVFLRDFDDEISEDDPIAQDKHFDTREEAREYVLKNSPDAEGKSLDYSEIPEKYHEEIKTNLSRIKEILKYLAEGDLDSFNKNIDEIKELGRWFAENKHLSEFGLGHWGVSNLVSDYSGYILD